MYVLLIKIEICADMWSYVRFNVVLLTGNYVTMHLNDAADTKVM